MRNYNNNGYNVGFDDEEEAPKKKRFNLFEFFNREGKGVEKDELNVLQDPSLINFFKLFGRKIGRLFSINLVYVFGNFPFLFFAFYMGKFTQIETAAPAYPIYSAVYGSVTASPSPISATLLGIFGRTSTVYIDTTVSKVFLCLSALLIFTFGLVNVGCTRLIRSMVREEPVFFWSDFFSAIKSNLRQGLIYGVIDAFLCFMLVFDIIFFNLNINGSSMMLIFLFISWGMLILYSMMRMYIYLMMITFGLSLAKLIKNAVFFAILGIKRNILALLGIVLSAFLTYALCIIYMPIGIIIPFAILFSGTALMGAYAAYPKIKEIMIDPYYDADGNPKKPSADSSPDTEQA